MGVAMGCLFFVPLTGITLRQLPNEEMGNATAMYNLLRNIGGSVGIAFVTTMLARGAQIHQVYLASHSYCSSTGPTSGTTAVLPLRCKEQGSLSLAPGLTDGCLAKGGEHAFLQRRLPDPERSS